VPLRLPHKAKLVLKLLLKVSKLVLSLPPRINRLVLKLPLKVRVLRARLVPRLLLRDSSSNLVSLIQVPPPLPSEHHDLKRLEHEMSSH
jgi:predicted unusual protein kinase regulating ubiquinone biosynthesis (AarF/ABC1/UbiB family)